MQSARNSPNREYPIVAPENTLAESKRNCCRVLCFVFAGFLLGYLFLPRYTSSDDGGPTVVHYVQQAMSEELSQRIRGPIIFPWYVAFSTAASVWNELAPAPMAVIEPTDIDDIAETLRFMNDFPEMDIRIKDGGYDTNGYSSSRSGIILSLRLLNKVKLIDSVKGLVRVEGGASTQQVLDYLAGQGWGVVTPIYGSIGFVGCALSGCSGPFSRKFGLLSDSILAAKLVLWNGTIVHAHDKMNSDVLWALQGGGANNFGVVTEITVQCFRNSYPHLWTSIPISWDIVPSMLNKLKDDESNIPLEVSITIEGGLYPKGSSDSPLTLSISYFCENSACDNKGTQFLNSFANSYLKTSGPVKFTKEYLANKTRTTSIPKRGMFVVYFGGLVNGGSTGSAVEQLSKVIQGNPSNNYIYVNLWGGAIGTVSPDATAFPHRQAKFNLGYVSMVNHELPDAARKWREVYDQSKQTFDALRPSLSGMHPGYKTLALSSKDAVKMYFLGNLPRLIDVKERYDPFNRFGYPQGIPIQV